MKQLSQILLLAGTLASSAVLADVSASYMPQDQTATQQYRHVGSQEQAMQVQQQTPTQTADAPQNPAAAQIQMNASHIAYLNSKADSLMSQINNMNHMVETLGQQIAQLQSAQLQTLPTNTVSFWQQWANWAHAVGPAAYVNLGGAAVLFVGFGFVAGRVRRRKHANVQPKAMPIDSEAQTDAAETESEYNFMATDEAIPAQLDLARSYVAMDDHMQAKTILEKIIARGDEMQQKEANDLLAQINEKAKAKAESA